MSRTFVEGLLLHCLTLLHPDKTRRAVPPGVVTHAAAWDKIMNERQRRSMSMLHLLSDSAIFFGKARLRTSVLRRAFLKGPILHLKSSVSTWVCHGVLAGRI